MKKLFLTIFIFLAWKIAIGQFAPIQNLGCPTCLVQIPGNGSIKGSLINRTFADTVAANLTPISLYPFSQIGTISPVAIWYRNYAATAWVQISAGSSATTIYTGDGTILTPRLVTLNNNYLNFSNDGFASYLLLDPTDGAESVVIQAIDTAGGYGTVSGLSALTSPFGGYFDITANFNGGTNQVDIIGSTSASEASLTYLATQQTFYGNLTFASTVSGSANDSVLTIDSLGNVRMRSGLLYGRFGVLGEDDTATQNRVFELDGHTLSIEDGVSYIQISAVAGNEYVEFGSGDGTGGAGLSLISNPTNSYAFGLSADDGVTGNVQIIGDSPTFSLSLIAGKILMTAQDSITLATDSIMFRSTLSGATSGMVWTLSDPLKGSGYWGAGGGGGNTIYTGDGVIDASGTGNIRTVDLDSNNLIFKSGANNLVQFNARETQEEIDLTSFSSEVSANTSLYLGSSSGNGYGFALTSNYIDNSVKIQSNPINADLYIKADNSVNLVTQFLEAATNSITSTAATHTFNGTMQYNAPPSGASTDSVVVWNSSTNVLGKRPGYSASSGLTMTDNNTVLGGTLTGNTTINTAGFGTTFTGTNNFPSVMLAVTNNGTGYGIVGTVGGASGTAVTGVGGNGLGVTGTATGGYAITGAVVGSGIPGQFSGTPSTAAAITPILVLQAQTSTTATAGIGGSIDLYVESGGGNNVLGNQFISKLTTVTAGAEVSQFIIKGMTGGASADKLVINGDGSMYGTGLHNVGTPTGTTTQYIASGTFTPTLFNTTNIAASTAYSCQWIRVGNVVTVSGKVDIDVTLGIASELGMSLPIASAMTADENLGGTASSAAAASLVSAIRADATNDRAAFVFTAVSLTNDSYAFEFTYLIK